MAGPRLHWETEGEYFDFTVHHLRGRFLDQESSKSNLGSVGLPLLARYMILEQAAGEINLGARISATVLVNKAIILIWLEEDESGTSKDAPDVQGFGRGVE